MNTKKFLMVAAAVTLLDQASKLIVKHYSYQKSFMIFPGILSITYRENTGAGFSILKGYNFFLAIVALTAVLGIIYFRMVIPQQYQAPAAVIAGASAGNLIDRILYGYVIDFIDIGFWPVFNIADSALSVSIVWIFYLMYKEERRDASMNKRRSKLKNPKLKSIKIK
ncbi:MAG: signal peptidase II [Candidatus Woesearchaeota archaeon]